jgi:hypothetical protein
MSGRGTTLAVWRLDLLLKSGRSALFGRYSLEKGGIFYEGAVATGIGADGARRGVVGPRLRRRRIAALRCQVFGLPVREREHAWHASAVAGSWASFPFAFWGVSLWAFFATGRRKYARGGEFFPCWFCYR